MSRPTLRDLVRRPVHLLAFGFGAGLAPKAPGTAGTLVGVALFLVASPFGLPWYLLTLAATLILGVWVCGTTARDLGVHDHPGIVWDEVAGYLVTMTALPREWGWILAGFVVFRVLDIVKPWPINLIDRRLGGGPGIMLDDVAAGVLGWILLHLALLRL